MDPTYSCFVCGEAIDVDVGYRCDERFSLETKRYEFKPRHFSCHERVRSLEEAYFHNLDQSFFEKADGLAAYAGTWLTCLRGHGGRRRHDGRVLFERDRDTGLYPFECVPRCKSIQ